MAKIVINDIFDELKHENKRLLHYLTKCGKLLEKYRNCLIEFNNNCNCDQNINNKNTINLLENEYKNIDNYNKCIIDFTDHSYCDKTVSQQTIKSNNNSIQKRRKRRRTKSEMREKYQKNLWNRLENEKKSKTVSSIDTNDDNNKDLLNQSIINNTFRSSVNILRRIRPKLSPSDEEKQQKTCDKNLNKKTVSEIKIKPKPDNSKQNMSQSFNKTYPVINISSVNTNDSNSKVIINPILANNMCINSGSILIPILPKPNPRPENIQLKPQNQNTIFVYQTIPTIPTVKLPNTIQLIDNNIKPVDKQTKTCEPKLEISKIISLQCKIFGCNFVAKTETELKTHRVIHRIVYRPIVDSTVNFTNDSQDINQRLRRSSTLTKHEILDIIENYEVITEREVKNEFIKTFWLKTESKKGLIGFGCDYESCEFVTGGRNHVQIHINRKHSSEKRFSCNLCDYKSTTNGYINIHKKMVHNVDPLKFKCDFDGCDAVYALKSGLQRHRRTHNSNGYHYCPHPSCDAKFDSEVVLKYHLMRHKKVQIYRFKRYTCKEISDIVSKQDVIVKRDKHNQYIKAFWLEDNDKKKLIGFGCDYKSCNYVCPQKHTIEGHIRGNHTFEKIFSCDLCDFKTANHSTIYSHKNIVHNDNAVKYKCDFDGCDYETKVKNNLKIHKNRHSGVREHPCHWPGCEMSFYTSRENLAHIQSVHSNIRKYACVWPGCDRRFKILYGLRKHERLHRRCGEEDDKYVCDWPECGAKFYQNEYLKAHKLIHSVEKPYLCSWPECNKKFISNSRLGSHMKLSHRNK